MESIKSNENWKIVSLRDRKDITEKAAAWFHTKWNVPEDAYMESITASQRNQLEIPQWYVVINDKEEIIGGLGLISNDFHKRKDLEPNVCAVYVEKEYRNQGIARAMLEYACNDAYDRGYEKVYLITGHKEFYEKCGWTFLCMVEEDNGNFIRMYVTSKL